MRPEDQLKKFKVFINHEIKYSNGYGRQYYCIFFTFSLRGKCVVCPQAARRSANIDSDHMLVVIKLRASICRDKD
jgi:hypothetical protein